MQINVGTPLCSDPCARLKTQIPMHSINWGCPKTVRHSDPISLLISTFGIHLEPGCNSHEQIIHCRTAKNVQKQATVLLYFYTISYQLTWKGFPVVWPVVSKTTVFISSEIGSQWRTILGHPQPIECMGICILSLAQDVHVWVFFVTGVDPL